MCDSYKCIIPHLSIFFFNLIKYNMFQIILFDLLAKYYRTECGVRDIVKSRSCCFVITFVSFILSHVMRLCFHHTGIITIILKHKLVTCMYVLIIHIKECWLIAVDLLHVLHYVVLSKWQLFSHLLSNKHLLHPGLL